MSPKGDKLIKMWEDRNSSGFHTLCEYDQVTNNFLVTVTFNGYVFNDIFEAYSVPVNGIDVADLVKVQELSDRLIKELEHMINEC